MTTLYAPPGYTGRRLRVADYGGSPGLGVDNTAAILAAQASAQPGDALVFDPGVWQTDYLDGARAPRIPITYMGADLACKYGAYIRPLTDAARSVIDFTQIPLPAPGGEQQKYGPGLAQMGIDMSGAFLATGIKVGPNTGWAQIRDAYLSGGAVSIENNGTNSSLTHLHLTDAATRFLLISGDTGLELELTDIAMARNIAGVMAVAVEIVATTPGTAGALYANNVRLQTNAGGGSIVTTGMRVSSVTNKSVPMFLDQFVIDNITGGGAALDLIRVGDVRVSNGWFNAGNSGPAIQIDGGFNLHFVTNQYFGGPAGLPSVYKFVGATQTNGFVSIGNSCPTTPAYRLPGANKPVNMICDDRVAAYPVTNDVAGLLAGTAYRSSPQRWADTQLHAADIVLDTMGAKLRMREGGAGPVMGYAVLVAGQVVVPTTAVTAGSRVHVTRVGPSVTAVGHLSATNNAGVSITIKSETAPGVLSTEASGVVWMILEPAV